MEELKQDSDENMWGEDDDDFGSTDDENADWDDIELNDDGQQLIPIQTSGGLTLATVLESINLPSDTNLNDISPDILAKLVEKLPTEIFEQLHEKYGDKIEKENKAKKKQKYRYKLSDIYNLQNVIDLIQQKSKILILTGAGISTSANIPDFRSKGGIYQQFEKNEQIKNVLNDDPTNIYDLEYFLNDPSLFYKYGTDKLFNDNDQYIPTKTHYFIKAIQDKNKLYRVHTQNIDGLELKAGIKTNKINHCHGTTSIYSCINCKFTIKSTSNFIKQHLKNKSIPYCIKCKHDIPMETEYKLDKTDIICNEINICWEEKDDFTNIMRIRIPSLLIKELKRKTNILKSYPLSLEYSINKDINNEMFDIVELRHDDDEVLNDLKLQIINWLQSYPSFGVLKPDTIFFNESLKTNTLDLIFDDVKHCDLVFVIGTSMLVDPFASIPNLLDKNIPLILINREVVGLTQYQFDVNLLGNCDEICETLLFQMKWNYDYNNSINQYQYKFISPNYCLFKDGKLPSISSSSSKQSQQSMLMQTDNKMEAIIEEIEKEEDVEMKQEKQYKWNIGDRIKYKYKSNINMDSIYDYNRWIQQQNGLLFDENDDYDPGIEYISYQKMLYRKRNWKNGDEIEYDSDPQELDPLNNHLRRGHIVDIKQNDKLLKVKLNTGHTINVWYDKISIGIKKRFWQCQICEFKNSIHTRQCMVCHMNNIKITNKSKRPNDDNNDDKITMTDWICGDGTILDIFRLNKEEMIKIKLKYGTITMKMNEIEIERVIETETFFVYGTLRDDDDSGVYWNKLFVKDSIASNAKLYGFKLYNHKNCNFPFAIKTNNKNDFIFGRLLYWNNNIDPNIFEKKLKFADQIEGYQGDNNDDNFYEREVVDAYNDNNDIIKAIVYYRKNVKNIEEAVEIPSGEWLKRDLNMIKTVKTTKPRYICSLNRKQSK